MLEKLRNGDTVPLKKFARTAKHQMPSTLLSGVGATWHLPSTAERLEPLVASCPVFTVGGTELPTSSCHFLAALVPPTVASFLSGIVYHLEVILPLYPAW